MKCKVCGIVIKNNTTIETDICIGCFISDDGEALVIQPCELKELERLAEIGRKQEFFDVFIRKYHALSKGKQKTIESYIDYLLYMKKKKGA